MLYVLRAVYDDDAFTLAIFEGPDGLNLDAMREEFYALYGALKPGKLDYPDYTGPMMKYTPSPCSSGAITGGMVADTECDEYKRWKKGWDKAYEKWRNGIEEDIEEIKTKYPGETSEEMFLSYLRQEKTEVLREVTSREYYI